MIAFILGLPSRLKLWAAAAFGVLMLGLAIFRRGAASNQAKHELKAARSYKTTVERVTDEKPSSATTDALRERMRQRARKP